MAHTCHAAGCNARVPPVMFTCRKHWYALPKHLRDRVWATYRPGQCDDWQISYTYADAARESVKYLAEKDGVSEEELEKALEVYNMLDPKRYE